MKYQKNFYEFMGLPRFASLEDVKKAHRALARKHHPDVGGNEKNMQLINSVYDILTKQKNRYDVWLREQLQPVMQPMYTASFVWQGGAAQSQTGGFGAWGSFYNHFNGGTTA